MKRRESFCTQHYGNVLLPINCCIAYQYITYKHNIILSTCCGYPMVKLRTLEVKNMLSNLVCIK